MLRNHILFILASVYFTFVPFPRCRVSFLFKCAKQQKVPVVCLKAYVLLQTGEKKVVFIRQKHNICYLIKSSIRYIAHPSRSRRYRCWYHKSYISLICP